MPFVGCRVPKISYINALLPVIIGKQSLIDIRERKQVADAVRSVLRNRQGSLTLLGVVEVAHNEALSNGALAARAYRSLLQPLRTCFDSAHMPVRDVVRVSRNPWCELADMAYEANIDLIILPLIEEAGDAGCGIDGGVKCVLENPPADIIIIRSSGHIQTIEAQKNAAIRHAGMETAASPVRAKRTRPTGITGHRTGNGADSTEMVDMWFAQNSFHAEEFSNINELLRLKERQGLTISLGLPTLNEEETVGDIINTIKKELFEKHKLIDDITVIDSGSVDNTVEIARSYGVEVFEDRHVLPEWGSRLGKGGALWKSLYLMNGDIIVWIDTDIKNIHPRFVYGLVGPLLRYPHLGYVKGFYRRPVKLGDHYFETGGGRVTELTARPLLNLFFPMLSGLVQPLSGEYAGRRQILERVDFYNGYGVEIGLLIDILEQFGIDTIGQVDLIERIHRNQPLASLSKMSSAIMQVVIDKLVKKGRLSVQEEINQIMRSIRHDPQQFLLEVNVIAETVKPPIITVPEYRRVFENTLSNSLPGIAQH